MLTLTTRDAARETGVLHTTTTIAKPSNRSVVAEALELILHRLRQHRAVHKRILRLLRREVFVKVGHIQRVSLYETQY